MENRIALDRDERILAQSDDDARPAITTPAAVRLAGHAGIGGRFRRYGVRSGLELTIFDLDLSRPFTGRAETEPCLAVIALISGAGEGRIANAESELVIPYRSERVYVFRTVGPTIGHYDIPAGARFTGVEVRASLAFVDRACGPAALRELTPDHRFHIASDESRWIGAMPMSRAMRRVTHGALASGPQQGGDLSIEARGLDIFTAALASLAPKSGAACPRPRQDIGGLREARRLLLANLTRRWTVASLARRVNMPEKRLKAGFRSEFGLPVYSFLQQSRLLHARQMLATTQASVTDTALAVGYSNPSHFSQLFLREFGMRPSDAAARSALDPRTAIPATPHAPTMTDAQVATHVRR